MSDLISRQAAISAICNACGKIDCDKMDKCEKLQLSPANISETPNSSDTISRQAAIDAVRGYLVGKRCPDDGTLTCRLIENEVINKLPIIQPEPHWIPVDLENNEPQLEEWVLVSSDGYVMQDCIVERGGKKIWYHGGNIQVNDRYMPLPEPYKGVTE